MSTRSFSKLSVQPLLWSANLASVANSSCQRDTSVASPRESTDNFTTVSWSSGSGSSQRKVSTRRLGGLTSRNSPCEVKQLAVGWLHGEAITASHAEIELSPRRAEPIWPPPLGQRSRLDQRSVNPVTWRIQTDRHFQDQSALWSVHGHREDSPFPWRAAETAGLSPRSCRAVDPGRGTRRTSRCARR